MTAAFKAACLALQLADKDDPITDIVARKIIEIAGTGERDPERICALVAHSDAFLASSLLGGRLAIPKADVSAASA
jgi:hypothetical protein